ncbi:hypothetical protein LguiA_034225 [Lonicera macranthoides]
MIQRLEPDLLCKQGTLSTTSTFPTRTQTLRTNHNEREHSRNLIDLNFLQNLEEFYSQHISKNQDDPTVGRFLDNFQEYSGVQGGQGCFEIGDEESCTQEFAEQAAMILWELWLNRNASVWKKTSISPTAITLKATASLQEWKAANSVVVLSSSFLSDSMDFEGFSSQTEKLFSEIWTAKFLLQ